MGTTKSGRYINTQGARGKASDFSVVHSNEGKFRWSNVKGQKRIRLEAGGHGETGRKMLDKYGIEYHIVTTFSNGVRVGYIPNHYDKRKRTGYGQSWFPKTWTSRDIRRAGEHVANLKGNKNVPDGTTVFGVYKGVRVGVKRTNGRISTIFPDVNQEKTLKRKNGRKKR